MPVEFRPLHGSFGAEVIGVDPGLEMDDPTFASIEAAWYRHSILLFRGLTPSEAKARLDAAREDLAARRLRNRETDEPFGQITFSAGVASVVAHPDPREALKVADDALYRAKQSGRNQVLVG